MTFDLPNLLNFIRTASDAELDKADFGIIGLTKGMLVKQYNRAESLFSGFSREFVRGKHFFQYVAPCMNNYRVALKFEQPGALDETLDYVVTYRMEPTPVSLRLLKRAGSAGGYLLVRKK